MVCTAPLVGRLVCVRRGPLFGRIARVRAIEPIDELLWLEFSFAERNMVMALPVTDVRIHLPE